MRYTTKKLQKLRSGHTVFRVLLWVRKDCNDEFTKSVEVTEVGLRGKKVLVTLGGSFQSVRMTPKSIDYGYGGPYFLNDLHGHGAFSSRRQAERFKQEILDGKHENIVRNRIEEFELDAMFERSMQEDYYDYPHDDYEYGDQGE